MNKWHLVFTFPRSGSTKEAPSRVVAIIPCIQNDPNRGLPAWFFDPYTAPLHKEDGRIVDDDWFYDSLEFWRDQDVWKFEWTPQMGPAPCWQTHRSLNFEPTAGLENWSDILLRLADWQRRTFGGV